MAEVGKSYKEVIQELLDENIYPEQFVIIAAVRMFLNFPILVITPKISEINTTQKRKVTHWQAIEWFVQKVMHLWINPSFRSSWS